MFSPHYRNTLFVYLLLILFSQLFVVFTTKSPDLCGGKKDFDLSPLNFLSPWRVSKTFGNTTHTIDILLCQNFSSLNDNIHENCKNSSICHKTTLESKIHYIGYVPIGDPIKEFSTTRVRYVGPYCSDQKVNYTVDIRFTCGSNLGYPSYPVFYLANNCSTILHWETSAACQGSSTKAFGLNERPCYVVDPKGNRRDLTPLIRPSGSYKVWSSDSRDFFINVCTDAVDKCGGDSSACTRNEQGQLESIGSYKWSSIEFYSSNEDIKYDRIELSYKTKNSKCKSVSSFENKTNESTTNIRFICAKDLKLPRRYPILVSSLDCRHEIEWHTNFACPQKEITSLNSNCKFDGVDFNQLKKLYKFDNLSKADGRNVSVLLNVCGFVDYEKCSKDSSVCIIDQSSNGKISPSNLTRRQSKFIKADNHLSLIYSGSKASCNTNGNSKFDRTIIEFECDPSIEIGEPKLVSLEDDCTYQFNWRTKLVCPLLRSNLNCTFESGDSKFQMDLSSLSLINGAYSVQRHQYEPKYFYTFTSTKTIFINICGDLPGSDQTVNCSSSACLVETLSPPATSNSSTDLGHFTQPLTYNKELKALQLLYTGGFEPKKNRSISTLINFYCESYTKDNQPYLVDYDSEKGQYVIEFKTPAACPIQTIQGSNCKVVDPLSNRVYDLKQLTSATYYPIKHGNYDFELNICAPAYKSSCGENVAICQIERTGQKRKFSLGTPNALLSYWNTILNITMYGGSPYNDINKTPRKSHISFLCDPTAGPGHPEFDGEQDRAYFFRWYTSLVCPEPAPKVTHCVFENVTHFFDLSPLSLQRGNHFVLGPNGSIVYINFCRPLNKIRDDVLGNCKANSGICSVENFNGGSPLSLGEPVGHPFTGWDGGIYMLYNNGDSCPHNKSRPFTSRVRFECDKNLEDDLSITFIDPNEDPISDDKCNYELLVRTPLACPRPLSDISLDKCIYTDKRTNFSVDLNQLTKSSGDYSLTGSNGPNSAFSLNICKPVKSDNDQCKNSAVCFHSANNSFVSYGSAQNISIYFEDGNLHLRYQNGTACDSELDARLRSTDIEFICDPAEYASKPVLYFQNHCLAKFKWPTSVVCNLILPTCSLVDDSTGDYYSLRHLSSMSHVWNVTSSFGDERYLMNVCKSLPNNHNCGPASAACKCKFTNGQIECNNIGKASDHELSLDHSTKDLILLYQDGDKICDGSVAQTHIRFRCSNHSGHTGPKLLNVSHCTHYFNWDTVFACSQRHLANYSVDLSLDEHFVVHDKLYDLRWDLSFLIESSFNVSEKERTTDNYTYVLDFKKQNSNKKDRCINSAICQTKANDFTRDIGSMNNWRFSFVGSDIYMILHSDNSVCGRNRNKNVTSKIRFECAPAVGMGQPKFLFESQDCDYMFLWETSHVCNLLAERPLPVPSHSKSAGVSPIWVVFCISLLALFAFAGWLFVSNSSARDDVVYRIRRIFRKNEAPQIPFRYQQLSL